MVGFRKCVIYIVVMGVVGFILGRLLPKRWFKYDAPPFRALPFENGGHFYRKLGIHRWHKRLPDMSHILPGVMKPKQLIGHITAAEAELMVQETCVAECTHALLSVMALYMLRLWPGPGGLFGCIAYILIGNVPFILIQRFNRPKLRMLLDKCRRAEEIARARQVNEQGQK